LDSDARNVFAANYTRARRREHRAPLREVAALVLTRGDAPATGCAGERPKITDEIVVLETVESQHEPSFPRSMPSVSAQQ
jgi:hypothetical protein